MFEKSLVDLIRGLRSHKGNENEYINGALRECRAEIRSQDMDVKATAMLKLIYLEMFGHDMSWASFNVLEVMSSSKHMQKRVGYLAAVQSFRTDTEVLMLATNLLKKDLSSPSIPTLSLPLVTLPHIVTSSLAISLLTDLLPRLSHSQPAVRKKTIVTLYRLALVYPETLRVAWPKIKERLMDEQENSSVTAAVINVVCELGWRRPQEFLPLAPRLFELLIEGGNNWMAIKIIKLFATLTPLEPRLVKKLVRPLTNLIQSTSAMSLLYECISGIIQGGILESTDGSSEGDEVANICIGKLRGLIVVEGDPNLKYVALLAFNRIVTSHPMLVAMQQDVIMDCLDDPDVSIRLQALELVSGMVNSETLQPIVNRLLRQLRTAPLASEESKQDCVVAIKIEPAADPDEDDQQEKLVADRRGGDVAPLSSDYRRDVITRILNMSSADTYANVTDFEWYLDVLVQMVRLVPPRPSNNQVNEPATRGKADIAEEIGAQIQDLAVRIRELRPEVTQAANSLVLVTNRARLFPISVDAAEGVLQPSAWVVGEFADLLTNPRDTLSSLIHSTTKGLLAPTLSIYVQALPKVFIAISKQSSQHWSSTEQTAMSLLLARIIDFLESLSSHPSLDVQERCVGHLELFRLAAEAVSSAPRDNDEPPLLVTSAIPRLFGDWEFNPVAPAAQKKVPVIEELDLGAPINPDLPTILQLSQSVSLEDAAQDEFHDFYHEREAPLLPVVVPAKTVVAAPEDPVSYQTPESPATYGRRKAERRARNKDDPFYIPQEGDSSGRSTPFHEFLAKSNGTELDIDSIPIIDLQIEGSETQPSPTLDEIRKQKKRRTAKKFSIAVDETIGADDTSSKDGSRPQSVDSASLNKAIRPKKNLLTVDSTGLRQLSLEGDDHGEALDVERREVEEAEMAAAMKEVERLRLQMQREAEMAEVAEGVDEAGTMVKRKKKRRPKVALEPNADSEQVSDQVPTTDATVKKKKRKKKKPETGQREEILPVE